MSHRRSLALRRFTAASSSLVVIAGALVGAAAVVVGPAAVPAAAAARAAGVTSLAAAAPALPPTVSADVLPTVQVNGVVWSQVTVGTTVYATGSFSSARPAGAPAGVNETPRGNLLAYDIRTGNLITGFAHSLNAQGLSLAASPDGRRVYVSGEFTTVDGATRNRVAAFDTATGALVAGFAPSFGSKVSAVTASDTVVYAGGIFTSVNGVARSRAGAVSASTGATLSWAPVVNDGRVNAIVLTPEGSRVVLGGSFTTVGSQPAYGLAATDSATGELKPWAAGATVRNAGANAAILSLKTDGRYVLGVGYVYGAGGNLEGAFAADPVSGDIAWLEDCHGDSYDVFGNGQVAYVASHEHACNAVPRGFPQTSPWGYKRATAFTNYATGTLAHNPIGGYYDFYGTPAPTALNWYPNLAVGKVTGQSQAAWSTTGNADYVAVGGEFPSINNVAQAGLARFAVRSIAPNKVGPVNAATLKPGTVSNKAGSVRVAWTATSDMDDETLTYSVIRDSNTAAPAYTTTVTARFFELPRIGFVDTGLAPGSTHTYRVIARDASGNSVSSATTTATVSTAALSPYAQKVLADGAQKFWRLSEPSGTAGYDQAGFDDLTLSTGTTRGAAGSVPADSDTATTFDGTTAGTATSSDTIDAPDTFSVEGWVRTTSTSGGKIIGFGNSATAVSSSYDRHLYLDDAGHVLFGVYNGSVRTIASPLAYNDGQWHQVVGTMSSAGMVLFVDGRRVGTNSTTTASPIRGFWRVGGDNLDGWTSRPTSRNIAADLGDLAVYPAALTATQVADHYTTTGRTVGGTPAPTDGYGKAVVADGPDLFWRLDDATGSTTAADSAGNDNTGSFSGGTTRGVASPVTGATGQGAALDGVDGLVSSDRQVDNPRIFSTELWFSTTSTSGGKLIGFGDAKTGLSNNYDRHVWMTNAGELVFGTYTGQLNTITSAAGYNDGRWHQVVATLSGDGMALYVDGARVGTNPTTSAQGYTGYWRVGGDHVWFGANSEYIAATVDEVAVYPAALSADRVLAHYRASSVAPAPANQAPTASFTATPTNLAVAYDATASSDPDGTIASYAWDFGDGTTATGATPTHTHTYTAAGTYPIVLTVTDNSGATATATKQVTVAKANQAPTASFTATPTNLAVAYDATASTDPDGTIASYAWDFGDGTTATGATPTHTHTYTAAGTYPIVLTVTDNAGATATATKQVTVTAVADPNANALVLDQFNRTVANGLGRADKGGLWSLTGTASRFSVAGGVASLSMATAGASVGAYLPTATTTDADTTVAVTTDKANDQTIFASVSGRRVSTNHDYRAKLRLLPGKPVGVQITKLAGTTTETSVAREILLPGVTFTPGSALRVRFQVTGTSPTTLRMKVWPAGTAEPAAWALTATDATAGLQAAGAVGITTYLSGSAIVLPVALRVTDLAVRPAA